MNLLLDTNILLRISETGSPFHRVCKQAVSSLLANGDALFIRAQNLIEYWAVATRPVAVNGLGFDPIQADAELRDFEKWAYLLPEPSDIAVRWRGLARQHNVCGKQAHDTRLVAFMEGHGLTNLVTLNGSDFIRYIGVTCISPVDIQTSTST
jgi:predicted nucleic acid-binding protein